MLNFFEFKSNGISYKKVYMESTDSFSPSVFPLLVNIVSGCPLPRKQSKLSPKYDENIQYWFLKKSKAFQ